MWNIKMVDDLALRNTESILEHRQKYMISMGYYNFANYEARFTSTRVVSVTSEKRVIYFLE